MLILCPFGMQNLEIPFKNKYSNDNLDSYHVKTCFPITSLIYHKHINTYSTNMYYFYIIKSCII